MRLRVLIGVALPVLAACGDPAHGEQQQGPGLGAPLHLAAEVSAANVGDDIRLTLCAGDLRAPATLRRLEESFDPFVLRIGGTQQNGLRPDVADGRAGVTLRFDEPGDALLAFSTVPRAVANGSEAVLLSRHVKALLRVSRDGRVLTEPQAAVCARVGLRLELTPIMDPLGLVAGDTMPVKASFDGPALPGAALAVQHLPRRGTPVESRVVAGDAGIAEVPILGAGRYLVVVVHEVPGTPREVHEATLTFETGAVR